MSMKKALVEIHQKHDYLHKSFLIFRPNDFPLFLKPIHVRVETTCVLTGRTIHPGQYAYPCFSNPVRLSPYGPEKCDIDAALQRGDGLLPAGYHTFRIPTTEQLKLGTKEIEKKRQQEITNTAVKLLQSAPRSQRENAYGSLT